MPEYTEERKCNECIYHTGGQCRKWECRFTSVKEAEEALKKIHDTEARK
jgi:hypothetical protein